MIKSRRCLYLGLALALVASQTARAQLRTHTVRGVVFDSIARAPLAGAVVQIALVDTSAKAPRIFWTTAEPSGRFQIGGLPAGKFAIGFQSEALSALGLESPLRAFELADDSSFTLDLAIPSGATVRAQRCGKDGGRDNDGALAGLVVDSHGSAALRGAVVVVQWLEVVLAKGDFHTVPSQVTAVVADDGTYVACGLTSAGPIDIRVAMPGYRRVDAELSVPAGSVARQDFHLTDTSTSAGAGTLTGRVVHSGGKLVEYGRASIAALALEAPIVNGVFTLTGLPSGSWTVDVVAIGYEPQSALVEVAESARNGVTLTLGKRAQLLGAVNVVGRKSANARLLDDIALRSRNGGGTFFLPGNTWLASAMFPSDVARAAHGFALKGPNRIESRTEAVRFKNEACVSEQDEATLPTGITVKKRIAIYLDGHRYPATLEMLNATIMMRDVLAIETYSDLAKAPPEWRTTDSCAVFAVWTKQF